MDLIYCTTGNFHHLLILVKFYPCVNFFSCVKDCIVDITTHTPLAKSLIPRELLQYKNSWAWWKFYPVKIFDYMVVLCVYAFITNKLSTLYHTKRMVKSESRIKWGCSWKQWWSITSQSEWSCKFFVYILYFHVIKRTCLYPHWQEELTAALNRKVRLIARYT